jgi:hypothetical protein
VSAERRSGRCSSTATDPQIGDKPLGPVMRLEEGENGGGYGEVALLDTSYNRDLLPSLKANLLGASHRFAPLRYT